jgi:beta-glucosidase-like glycosyl hydrolase
LGASQAFEPFPSDDELSNPKAIAALRARPTAPARPGDAAKQTGRPAFKRTISGANQLAAFEVRAAQSSSVSQRLGSMTREQKIETVQMCVGNPYAMPTTGAIIVGSQQLDADHSQALARTMGRAERERLIPTLVVVDHEGGKLNRLGRHPATKHLSFPSAAELGRMSATRVRAEGEKLGTALELAGISALLGPVMDVADAGTWMAVAHRSFGSSPLTVSDKTQAFIDGLRQTNPALVILPKHFPGYNVKANSDQAKVEDLSSSGELLYRSSPFFQVTGADGVLVSAIRYPALDTEPACFSKKIIGILRQQQPDALVVTDDLSSPALLSKDVGAYRYVKALSARALGHEEETEELETLISKSPELYSTSSRKRLEAQLVGEIRQNAQRAFLAGCDVLLVMDSSYSKAISDGLTALLEERPELEQSLEASARRVLLLAARQQRA